ncbi:plasmid partitioning protein RepB [Paracoccus laeviglucosivorans]|uniref:Chromosome partitioning protein, ParB family n=1 Tax=Paracoccus laeviglucosivorans TaxID=1197861 RepID=A0A521FQ37_9RHOB|nr:plasmid partitioning protein RepB [Paracoccus laeviglucosivorans]SMO97581.1 chromosome partitioning protein, ParB family [Paracoccus laeviglucosivorans]
MARKSLSGMTGIASTIARSTTAASDRSTKITAPALGALQGSLAAIREIEPGLIDDWGPVDRLTPFTAVNDDEADDGLDSLANSIRDQGQQVPILVRKAKVEGRYEVIYGRRRLAACRDLGIKVRANVQDLDDATALIAKGLENAARRNLSFYERARFAQAILDAGHSPTTAKAVLNLSSAGLSHLTKITQAVPADVGSLIGAAQKSGRPKWTSLADLFIAGKLTEKTAGVILQSANERLTSDERLDLLIHEATKRGARHDGSAENTLVDGVTIRTGSNSVTLTVKRRGTSAGFASWLDTRLEGLIRQSYAEFKAISPQDKD